MELSEGKALGLAQEVPGFAVVGVAIPAGTSLGAKPEAHAPYHLTHRQNVPGFLRDDVYRDKIHIRCGVGDLAPVFVAENGCLILAVKNVGAGFYLYAAKAAAALDDEIITMVVTVGLRHHEAETDGFVRKGGFAEIPTAIYGCPTCLGSFLGRAPHARWNASARTGFAHY